MKHLIVAAVLIGVVIGWIAFFSESGGDALADRDALVSGPVAVDYEPGPAYGHDEGPPAWPTTAARWVVPGDGGWIFEPGERGPEAMLLSDGAVVVREIAEGCFLEEQADSGGGSLVSVPGITYARSLLSGMEVDRGEDEVEYEATDERGIAVEVEEDMSRLDEGVIESAVWLPGEGDPLARFTIRKLSEGAAAAASARIAAAEAPGEGDVAWLVLEIHFPSSNAPPPDDPLRRPVVRDCPEATLASPNAPELRHAGGEWVLDDAVVVDEVPQARRDELSEMVRLGAREDAALRPGLTFLVLIEPRLPGYEYVQVFRVAGCEGADWFRC